MDEEEDTPIEIPDYLPDLVTASTKAFPVADDEPTVTIPLPSLTQQELDDLIATLKEKKLSTRLYEVVFLHIERMLGRNTVPRFWEHFKSNRDGASTSKAPTTGTVNERFFRFQTAVKELYDHYRWYCMHIKRAETLRKKGDVEFDLIKKPNESTEFHRMMRGALLAHLPPNFNDLVYAFYSVAFKVFSMTHAENDDCMEGTLEFNCAACGQETAKCQCQTLANAFTNTNCCLSAMGLLDKIAGYTLTTLIQERIDAKVDETKENYAISHLSHLESWLSTIVLQWLTRVYNRGSLQIAPSDQKIEEAIANFQTKLKFYLYEHYAKAIIDQFFGIIIDFPVSQPAVDDLKICLEKVDLKSTLVVSIRGSLESKLLHPGVDTPDILTGYVAAIKTLRHLDSSGVLLQTITEPVKEYLRSRSDTVRCVVTGLTEEGNSDLSEELAKSENIKSKENVNENLELTDWENWNPDPVNVDPKVVSEVQSIRSFDIITMVVDIYGSKELFVNEYRNLLAERLLLQLDFNAEKEIRNLELLKMRFGESLLHSCEVMLKDMIDSKRINSHIMSSDSGFGMERPFEISALIVSSQFWPTFKKETMELPPAVKSLFDRYTQAYETYKGNRTLHWTPLNGKVTIDIEIDGKTQEMQVTPAQATIAIYFSEQPEWELERLSHKMNMPASVLRKRLMFWQAQGIIREKTENLFALVDKSKKHGTSEDNQAQSADVCEDEEAESAMESASDQREEELQVFWSYIEAMLTNLDSLPLDRIHQMLKMFASQVDFSQEELKIILQRKVREHKLVYAGGVYQLPKS